MSTTITILGNTGRDVELRYNQQGVAIASFSVASSTTRNTTDGPKKKTDWYNVSAFGRQAETLAKYLTKGSQILVRGRLDLSAWQTRSGEPRVNADVLLQDFEFAGANPAKSVHESAPATTAEPEAESDQAAPAPESAEDIEEKAEMMAAVRERDLSDEAFAGQF
jgi:single-strand DNA-binding protein